MSCSVNQDQINQVQFNTFRVYAKVNI